MKRETNAVIEIEGMDRLGVLLEVHDNIARDLRANANEIGNLLHRINCKINQPSEGTDD